MKTKGFTLVELLVVISIIAILSVIGITIFSSAQKTARDAKRRGDIDAIAKALEVNYGQCTSAAYCNLQANYLAGNAVPVDPLEGQNQCGSVNGSPTACTYCFLNDGDLDYKYRGTNNAHRGCTRAPNGSGGSYGYSNAQIGGPGGGSNYVTYYILCVNLETPLNGKYYYCKISQQ